MIDTYKYEGHTPAPWGIKNAPYKITYLYGGNDTKICSIITPHGMFAKTKGELKLSRECANNARLIEDAPKLLAEVKRLREATQQIIGNIELWCNGNTVPKDILMEKLKEMIE